MTQTDDESPKPVDELPDRPLEISFCRKLRRSKGVRRLWIRRYPSRDALDEVGDGCWETSVGVVPTTGIERFVVEWRGRIVTFEYDDGEGWFVTDESDRDALDWQVFTYQMKSFVTLERAIRARRFDEDER